MSESILARVWRSVRDTFRAAAAWGKVVSRWPEPREVGEEMLIVKVKNITRTFVRANYHFEVLVNDKVVSEGLILGGFYRKRGYAALLKRVADQVCAGGDPRPEDANE